MGHHHHHHPTPKSFSRAFAWGVGLNLVYVITEATFGFLTNSLALLADAGHNLGDVFTLLLAWGASALAARKPSEIYTYGLRRVTILASLVSGLLLLVALGGIIWEAAHRFSEPVNSQPLVVIIVAAIGVGINTLSAFFFLAGKDHDLNIRAAFLHLAADAAVSLGVVISGVVMYFTSWLWPDPTISILIALIVFIQTWDLLRDSVKLSLDAVPAGIVHAEVINYFEELTGVDEVHDLHIWAMSTTEIALTVHLVIPDYETDDEFLHNVSHELEDRFKIAHPTIQIERGTATCHLADPNHV